ncbi:MAG: alpha-L-arabinofuranosidase [Planctomycetota bacterium]|nr:MAG: alpha-L-arabinofuranosidase [Planctomycetota bacterium]
MKNQGKTRRHFLKTASLAAAATMVSAQKTKSKNLPATPQDKTARLHLDPEPKFPLSPYLYMQFMEPLGVTDGSVAAAWNFKNDHWHPDVIKATQELAPTLIRWGGLFASYYRWKEAVGPRDQRKTMLNLVWGGVETNQVGTHEFVDFCRQVGADPLLCVNFESDGKKHLTQSPKDGIRSAGPQEAAEWVDYCNNPSNTLRLSHGVKEPYNLKLWQIGNETSYGRHDWSCETAAKKTISFARAMRKADPNIELIGWGDSGWARKMAEIAGEHLQYLAFHHMFNPDRGKKDSPLRGIEYRKDPDRTWESLMRAPEVHDQKIRRVREQLDGTGMPLAMTECHFALPGGRNRCEVLSTWAAGVANARLLNVNERHGDVLKIATLADFCGTRWQVNAIMIHVPAGRAFMMPVAMVMSLYRKHTGQQAVNVTTTPDGLDVTASRTENRLFLHVVNTNRTRPIAAKLTVDGMNIQSGRVFTLATDPEYEVIGHCPDILSPKEQDLPDDRSWTFPAASVSAVELDVI